MIDSVVGVGSVLSLLLLIAQMRQTERPDLWWSRFWFACALLTFLGYALARESTGSSGFIFATIYTTALVALYPIQYLHVRSVTGAPARIIWPHALVPLSNVIFIFGLQTISNMRTDTGLLAVYANGLAAINLITIMAITLLAAYPWLALRRLINARRVLAFRQGPRSSERYNWLIAWCASTFLLVLAGWISDLGALLDFISLDAVAWLTFGTLALQLVLVGFFVTGTHQAFSPMPGSSTGQENKDLDQLIAHFQTEKPFLQSGISTDVLADQMGWTGVRLTAAVRAGGASHFNDYLNRWRVEEVISRIKLGNDASILQLALDAGFGSKSSFNDAFKRHTGLTPTEFRRRLQSSG